MNVCHCDDRKQSNVGLDASASAALAAGEWIEERVSQLPTHDWSIRGAASTEVALFVMAVALLSDDLSMFQYCSF